MTMTSEERQKKLDKIRGKLPKPKKRFSIRRFMRDPAVMDALMENISAGNSIKATAKALKLKPSAATSLGRFLAALRPGDEWYDEYVAASEARAMQFADRMLEIIDQVELGTLTVQQGAAMTKSLTWLAGRLDPARWGDRMKVDQNIKLDTATAHLEAVREMASMVRDDISSARPVIEAEALPSIDMVREKTVDSVSDDDSEWDSLLS